MAYPFNKNDDSAIRHWAVLAKHLIYAVQIIGHNDLYGAATMRMGANVLTFSALAFLPLASPPALAQVFDPAAGAEPIAPITSGVANQPPSNPAYSWPANRNTLPSNIVPDRYRIVPNTASTSPGPYSYGTTFNPAIPTAVANTVSYVPTQITSIARPNALPEQVVQIEYQNKLTVLNAIDTGNVVALRTHFAQIHAGQASGVYTPGAIDLNFLDQAGNTPAMRAALRGNVEIMQALVSEGASLQGANYSGQTVASISAQYGHSAMSQYLASGNSVATAPAINSSASYSPMQTSSGKASAGIGMSDTTLIAGGAVVLAGAGGVALALGGGGGSGENGAAPQLFDPAGTHPFNLDPASFRTTEAQTQSGILTINADEAYARGYEGQIYSRTAGGALNSSTPTGFVKVAITDTGVDLTHPDLDGNQLSGSVSCTNAGCTAGGSDVEGHGTNVTGVILAERNGTGMQGVAPQAKFISVGIANSIGSVSSASELRGLQYALTQNVQVINSSYGGASIDSFSPSLVRTYVSQSNGSGTREAAYQNMVSQGVINVWAAGNDGPTSEPSLQAALPIYFQGASAPAGINQTDYNIANPSGFDWSRNWVAVVSVDSGLSISSFSSKCGVARDWCLAAPGEIASTTSNGGGYNATAGTSFSAPHVTGALAVLLGAFPQLAPETALQILFNTATDLGATGVDDVYGHGLVNLDRATSPTLGGWTLATGAFSSVSFASSGFNTSGAFGNALARSNAGIEFRDAYGKNYTVPLTTLASSMEPQPGWLERTTFIDHLAQSKPMMLGETAQLRFAFEPVANRDPTGVPDQEPVLALSETYNIADGIQLDARAEHRTNLAARMVNEPASRNTTEVLENPYLGLSERASSMQQTITTPGSSLTLLAYHADLSDSPETYNFRFQTDKPLNGVYSAARFKLGQDTQLELNQGMVWEERSMLGSESEGAFALGRSNTLHAGIQATHRISDRLKLFGRYDRGRTETETTAGSLFNDIGTVSTDSFVVGLGMREMFEQGDRLHLSVSQPLRIQSGQARLTLPVATARSGENLFDSTSLNLSPNGREQNLRMSYQLPLVGQSAFSLDAIYRDDANHVAGAQEAAFYTSYSLAF